MVGSWWTLAISQLHLVVQQHIYSESPDFLDYLKSPIVGSSLRKKILCGQNKTHQQAPYSLQSTNLWPLLRVLLLGGGVWREETGRYICLFVCFSFFLFWKIKFWKFFLCFLWALGHGDFKTEKKPPSDISALSPSCPQDPPDKQLNPRIWRGWVSSRPFRLLPTHCPVFSVWNTLVILFITVSVWLSNMGYGEGEWTLRFHLTVKRCYPVSGNKMKSKYT